MQLTQQPNTSQTLRAHADRCTVCGACSHPFPVCQICRSGMFEQACYCSLPAKRAISPTKAHAPIQLSRGVVSYTLQLQGRRDSEPFILLPRHIITMSIRISLDQIGSSRFNLDQLGSWHCPKAPPSSTAYTAIHLTIHTLYISRPKNLQYHSTTP